MGLVLGESGIGVGKHWIATRDGLHIGMDIGN